MSTSTTTANTKKTVFITGSSTGFGRGAAERFAKDGWNVVATMRTPEKETELQKQGILVVALDATKPETIDPAVAAAVAKFGGIDVLVNNAGIAQFGPFVEESASLDQAREVFETNFFGAIRVTQAVLPIFRKQKSGNIVYISSVVATVTQPLGSAYNSSKAALNSYVECTAYELALFGIQNKIVMPGAFRTEILGKGKPFEIKDEQLAATYKPLIEGFGAKFGTLLPILTGPEQVVDAIAKAAIDQDPKNIFWRVTAPADPYAPLAVLRDEKGPAAQFNITFDAYIAENKKQ